MTEEPGSWEVRLSHPGRRFCEDCQVWIEAEPWREQNAKGGFVVTHYRLPRECPFCNGLLGAGQDVDLISVRDEDFDNDYLVEVDRPERRKRTLKLKAEPRQQAHCPWDGRFVPLNAVGRPRLYCGRSCQSKAYRARKTHSR